MPSSNSENFIKEFSQKNFSQTIQQGSSIFDENNNNLSLTNFNYISKFQQILAKITQNVNKNSNYHKILNLDNSL